MLSWPVSVKGNTFQILLSGVLLILIFSIPNSILQGVSEACSTGNVLPDYPQMNDYFNCTLISSL